MPTIIDCLTPIFFDSRLNKSAHGKAMNCTIRSAVISALSGNYKVTP